MKCQLEGCTNEGVTNVFRTVSGQEQIENTRGSGVNLNISKYHHAVVCRTLPKVIG